MIADFFQFLFSVVINIISSVLSLIFGLFGDIDLPAFDNFASLLQDFWDFIFQFIGYVRSIFLFDTFEFSLLITILSIKILYKPTIAVVKMFIGWFNKLKVG